MSLEFGSGMPGLDAPKGRSPASRLRIKAADVPATCAADASSRFEMSSSRLRHGSLRLRIGDTRFHALASAVKRVDGIRCRRCRLAACAVQPVGTRPAAFEIAKQHVALFYRVALAASIMPDSTSALFQPPGGLRPAWRHAVDLVDNRAICVPRRSRPAPGDRTGRRDVDPPDSTLRRSMTWLLGRSCATDLLASEAIRFDAFESFGVE
jgi:hypothetical protein